MYASVKTVADQSTGGATDATFIAVTGLQMSFNVEEDEMWCLVGMQGLVSNHVALQRVDFDVKVDGAFISGNANGLAGTASAVVDSTNWLRAGKLVRLTKGVHTMSGWFKSSTNTDVATIKGTVLPCELSVLRLSNNAVLAHGVDAKFQVTE